MDIEKEYTMLAENAQSVPKGSIFKGRLTRPGEEVDTFVGHEILQSDTQIIGRTKITGIAEWIVINVASGVVGTFKLVSPDPSLPEGSIAIGAIISGDFAHDIIGSITIEQNSDGNFITSEFYFSFTVGGVPGDFSDGTVRISSSSQPS